MKTAPDSTSFTREKKKVNHTRFWHNHSCSLICPPCSQDSSAKHCLRGREKGRSWCLSLVTWKVTTQVFRNYKDKLKLNNSGQNVTRFGHSYGRNSNSKVRSRNTFPPTHQVEVTISFQMKACWQAVPRQTCHSGRTKTPNFTEVGIMASTHRYWPEVKSCRSGRYLTR